MASEVKARPTGSSGRGARRGRKPARRLTLEEITAVAMGIADAQGLDSVSIRRVAAELGAPPMSLYGHIGSKQDLLARMADEVIAEVLLPDPMPELWREALGAIAARQYLAFTGHSWVISILIERLPLGPHAHAATTQAARALEKLPVEGAEVWELFGAINDYILGFSLRSVAGATADDLKQSITDVDVAELPDLAVLPETARSRSSPERFQFGLELLLDGIERRLQEMTRPQ
jgi:AcrR family transcriptional regulator